MNVLQTSLRVVKHWVFGRAGEPIRYGRHTLRYVPGTRPVRLRYLRSPIGTVRYDALQVQHFLHHVREGDVVLDVGANVGQYAVLFGALVGPAGRVISFEPDPSSAALIRRNIALNGFEDRVKVEEIALYDENGTHRFYSRGGDANASLRSDALRDVPGSEATREFTVVTRRLDDYLQEQGIEEPAWIKLDTEGAEIRILQGAAQMLRSRTRILCELHPYAWESFGSSFEELRALVSRANRRVRYLDPTHSAEEGPMYGPSLINRLDGSDPVQAG